MTKRVDQFPHGAFQPIASNWCHSVGIELVDVKVDFEWTIHDYELRGPGNILLSTKFPSVTNNFESTWHLELEDKLDNCNISLRGYTIPTHDMRVKIAFVNARREKVFSNEIFTRQRFILINRAPRETLLDKSNDLIVNGALTIYCEIETYENNRQSLSGQIAHGISQPSNDKEELVKNFEKLFESMEHSDVTFNVRGKQFQAHKNILTARSPVFAAMFQHQSAENMTGIVDVPDI